MGFVKKTLTAMAVAVLALPVTASPADEPSGTEMAMDMAIGRPVGLVVTALGVGVFVISLPFSALGGNVEQAANTLVVEPAKATFVRCLGCKSTGRYTDPDDVEDVD